MFGLLEAPLLGIEEAEERISSAQPQESQGLTQTFSHSCIKQITTEQRNGQESGGFKSSFLLLEQVCQYNSGTTPFLYSLPSQTPRHNMHKHQTKKILCCILMRKLQVSILAMIKMAFFSNYSFFCCADSSAFVSGLHCVSPNLNTRNAAGSLSSCRHHFYHKLVGMAMQRNQSPCLSCPHL